MSAESLSRPPFLDPLVESGIPKRGSEHFLALQTNPDTIIRESNVELGEYFWEKCEAVPEELKKLREVYGLHIPKVDIVVGPGSRGIYDTEFGKLYIVTERIHGETLKDIQFEPEEYEDAHKKLDPMFAGMTRYYHDILDRTGYYIDDLANRNTQIVWGKKRGVGETLPYFVDVGLTPMYRRVEDKHAIGEVLQSVIYDNYGSYRGVFGDMLAMERKIGLPMQIARAAMQNLVEDVLSRPDSDGFAQEKAAELKYLLELPPGSY